MSFFTSLTGLNAATAQLGVTSNNIANASTVGFKRSRADFGDIFATSPLQKATSTIGQGVSLKKVVQEFGQGNLNFSANTLDLAISGDGFFPLKSADGFQDIFTRNGAFMMNDQYNVVNSAGQRLMAASVDSTGKANLSDMNVLTIPQKTVGMAKETSVVQLGLNFPADAQVMTKAFNRNDPDTYNKSTALTVYDKGGNGYLATVYYSKTQNASQADPNNKWQTNVYVGETLVAASLQQATDTQGQPMYVNKYGDLKPESEVADLLTNSKTAKFSLNDLKDLRTSVAAMVTGGNAPGLSSLGGIDFTNLTKNDLKDLFSIDIDGSGTPVSIGLEHLAGLKNGQDNLVLNGVQIAKELTNVINRKLGDERLFNFKAQQSFQLTSSLGDGTLTQSRTIQLDDNNMTYEQVIDKINSQLKGSSSVLSNVGFNQDPPEPGEFKGYSMMIGGQHLAGKISLGTSLSPKPLNDLVTALQSKIQDDLKSELGYTDDAASKVTVNLQNGNEIRVTDANNHPISSFALSAISTGSPNEVENSKTLTGLDNTYKKGDYANFALNIGDVPTINIDLSDIDPSQLDSFAQKIQAKVQSALSVARWSDFEIGKVSVSVDSLTSLVVKDAGGHAISAVSMTVRTTGAEPLPVAPVTVDNASTVKLKDLAFASKAFGKGDLKESLISHFKSLELSITPAGSSIAVPFSVAMTADNFPSLNTGVAGATTFTSFDPTSPDDMALFITDLQAAIRTEAGAAGLAGANNLSLEMVQGALVLTEEVADGATPEGFFIGSMTMTSNDAADPLDDTAVFYGDLQKGAAETSFYREMDSNGTVYPSNRTISNVNFSMNSAPIGDEFKSFSLDLGDTSMQDIDLDTIGMSNLPMNDLALKIQEKIRAYLTNLQDPVKFPDARINQVSVSVVNGKDLKINDLGGSEIKAFSLKANPASANVSSVSAGGKNVSMSPLVGINDVTASYDPVTQKFSFTPEAGNSISLSVGKAEGGINTQLGISGTLTQVSGQDGINTDGGPSTIGNNWLRDPKLQRFGMQVEYDGVNETFNFKSGTTGDDSSIAINNANAFAAKRLGLASDATYEVKPSMLAERGKSSTPAVMTGSSMGINPNNNFSVNLTNNKFVVSVDDIKGTVYIEPKDSYTIESFTLALQNAINRLAGPPDEAGLTGSSVSGVKVGYNPSTNSLTFTSGTASNNSFIKVSGDAQWGLSNVDGSRGTTTTWIKPTQYAQDVNGVKVPMYIDAFGKETFAPDGFKDLPEWSPIFLEKGELTFDTSGNLVSPKQGSQLDTVFLPDGKGSLRININYSKSTQFSSPYAVLSQSQDGTPEGDLVGLSVGDDGLVNASYSNGSQKSLGKVVLVNFSNPSGLRQIGDTSYYKSANSGSPKYGEAGSAGYGTVRSGATERANVDLTQELVDLITEQRNFQANAKAIETSTTLTQSIIQIRA